MEIYISDSKVVKEAFVIIDETYSSEELEKFIMKCLRKYKVHSDYGNGGWYNIYQYVSKQYKLENNEN